MKAVSQMGMGLLAGFLMGAICGLLFSLYLAATTGVK